MAALRPCPVRITAPVSTNLTRFQPRYGSILPLERNSTMLKIRAPLYPNTTLLKISRGIRAHSQGGAAGQPVKPGELFVSGLTPEEKKKWEKLKEIAKGPPDRPFREEIDVIEEYLNKARDEIFYCKSILHRKGAILTWKLCRSVRNAVVLASKVVNCVVLRHGSPDEISLNTTKQMMRTYVDLFVTMAEDIHHKKVRRETIVSLLGAIQVNRAHLEYQVEMNNFKDELTTAHPELLERTVHDVLMCTEVYVRKMIITRRMATMRGAAAREPADDE